MIRARAVVAIAGALCAVACHRPPERTGIDAIDNQLVNGAVTAESGDVRALRGAIHVDRRRITGGATATPRPATTAATATPATAASPDGACLSRYGAELRTDRRYGARLPPEFPAAPGATLTEAAGHDGGCAIRIASYVARGTPEAVLGWYAAKAKAGGYTADGGDTGGDRILAGTKGAAAFYIMAGPPKDGATPVDLVWAATG